jgi:hypothetical protein
MNLLGADYTILSGLWQRAFRPTLADSDYITVFLDIPAFIPYNGHGCYFWLWFPYAPNGIGTLKSQVEGGPMAVHILFIILLIDEDKQAAGDLWQHQC